MKFSEILEYLILAVNFTSEILEYLILAVNLMKMKYWSTGVFNTCSKFDK